MFADEVAQPPETRLYLLAEAGAQAEAAETEAAETEAAETEAAETEAGESDPGESDPAATDPAETDRAETKAAAGEGDAGSPPVMAGYAGVMFAAGGTQADVLTIAVRPSCWGSGVGSALLAALVAAAREHGCTELFLEVRADNPRARGLYLRRGFTEIGLRRGYYQPSGVDAIVMRKDLSAC
jgi:ribosomal-protein-alanine acetyltransferase